MIRHSSFVVAACCLPIVGCTVGPDYERPGPLESPAPERGAFLRAGKEVPLAPAAHWWEDLGDPVLTDLIETGLANSPVIDQARARVRQARAGVSASRAALLPALSTSATYVYADLPNQAFGTGGVGNEFVTLGFDARWEMDLWGENARVLERSRADAAAAEAMLADAQVSLSAEIARTYVVLQSRQASADLLEERSRADVRLVALVRKRFDGGTATRQDLTRKEQQLAGTEAELAQMEAEAGVLRDALAVLTGTAPGGGNAVSSASIPLPPAEVRTGDPAAMLARRPDVIVAERRLAAATASIGEAQARRFPAISLLGLVGIGGSDLGDVFDSSQLSMLAVPRLTWSFLDFGRTAAAVRGARAGRDAALAEYRSSVLTALQDAEAALARFGAARIAFARAGSVSRAAAEISRLENMRARAGTASEVDALEAVRTEIDARLAETNSRASLTICYIALAKSLGLGWQVKDTTAD